LHAVLLSIITSLGAVSTLIGAEAAVTWQTFTSAAELVARLAATRVDEPSAPRSPPYVSATLLDDAG